jgi:hypothetical protein
MPDQLLVMRYEDMGRIHPNQDNSKKCSKCGHQVGIYPTGQGLLKKKPKTIIVCSHCVGSDYDGRTVAPIADMMRESRESYPKPK